MCASLRSQRLTSRPRRARKHHCETASYTTALSKRYFTLVARRLTHRAVLVSTILITLGIVGAFFAYGQIMTHPTEKASPVPFNTIYQGNGADGYTRPADILIENQTAWSNVWDTAFCSQGQCPPLPDVNFTSRNVIAVFYGFGGHASDTIGIDWVSRSSSTLNVHVLVRAGGNCASPLIVVYSAHIIDIPKTDLPVSFSTQTIPSNC